MKIVVDTNILIRAAIQDDDVQAGAAVAVLRDAGIVAISAQAICEFVWVLRRLYKVDRANILSAIEKLISADNVVVDRAAYEAGLSQLKAGGDFADGLIAYEGAWLGGDAFVSFDKQAVAIITKQGREARLL